MTPNIKQKYLSAADLSGRGWNVHAMNRFLLVEEIVPTPCVLDGKTYPKTFLYGLEQILAVERSDFFQKWLAAVGWPEKCAIAEAVYRQRLGTAAVRLQLTLPALNGKSEKQVSAAGQIRETALIYIQVIARQMITAGTPQEEIVALANSVVNGPIAQEAKHWLAHDYRVNKCGRPLEYWTQVLAASRDLAATPERSIPEISPAA